MKVLFKVSRQDQITAMSAVLSGKETFGDDIHIATDDDGTFDLVINVASSFKGKAIIFDHSGTIHRLGFPDDIEYDSLPSKDDGMRINNYKEREQVERKPKECPSCKFMKPIGVYTCPKCGYEPIANEDVETDETRGIEKVSKNKKRTEYSQSEKQSWWSQILFYQHHVAETKNKHLSDGWCAHVYKSKFGVWPKKLNYSLKEIGPEVRNFILSKQIAFSKSRGIPAPKVQQELSLAADEVLKNADYLPSVTKKILEARRQPSVGVSV